MKGPSGMPKDEHERRGRGPTYTGGLRAYLQGADVPASADKRPRRSRHL